MSTDNLLALIPADLWDGLPAGTRFTDLKQALLMDRPGRDLLEIQWDMGPSSGFGTGGNLHSSLQFTVHTRRVGWPVYAKPKSVAKFVLSDGVMYKVTPTTWLLDEE